MQTGVLAIDTSDAPFIVGSDEVGFGAWAGPLAVCAVAVPRGWVAPSGLTDSKLMTTAQMEKAQEAFFAEPAGSTLWGLWWAEATTIDEEGVGPVLRRLHREAVTSIRDQATALAGGHPPLVIVDGNVCVEGAISLPKADRLVPAVSMASVIAKLARDKRMAELSKLYPMYGFKRGVGYGTAAHRAGLDTHGPCEEHRKSYAPIRDRLQAGAASTPREAWLDLPEE